MWHIEEHRRVDKQLSSAPREILKRYEKWKDIAMLSGPPGLRQIRGFNDEALWESWMVIDPAASGCNGELSTRPYRTNSYFSSIQLPRMIIGGRK